MKLSILLLLDETIIFTIEKYLPALINWITRCALLEQVLYEVGDDTSPLRPELAMDGSKRWMAATSIQEHRNKPQT